MLGIIFKNTDNKNIIQNLTDKFDLLNIDYILHEINTVNTEFAKPDTLNEVIDSSDILIAIGGDGTIMHVAKQAAAFKKPVLGINSGRVGFMAGLELKELELLEKLKTGEYKTERRMLMMVEIINSQNETVYKTHSLNEAVVSRGAVARIADLEVKINNTKPIFYRADGVIAATPTGSTAYSLSAGGPVLDPESNGMIITPICPHSINSRSIVVRDTSEITISNADSERCDTYLCVDGENPIKLNDSIVKIKKSDIFVELIKIKNDDFYEIFNRKILSDNK